MPCHCMAHLDISPSTGHVSLLFRSQAAFIWFLPLLHRKNSWILHSLQASPFMVHYIHWLILLSPQYVGHHPHLYALTFSNYFPSSCLSLKFLPCLNSLLTTLSHFFILSLQKKRLVCFVLFCFNKRHCLIRSFISLSFIMELVYYQHFFLQISGEISLSYSHSNSYGEQVLFYFLFFWVVANYRFFPLLPALFMGVIVWHGWAWSQEIKPSILVPFPFTFRVAYKALKQSCEEGGLVGPI